MFNVSDNLTKLLNSINKNKEQYKILTREEELELISQYRDTNLPHLKKLLICHNLCLAISFSKKYNSTSVDYDSLLQDAIYGLCIAAEKFDFDAGVKFSRYAYIWIKKYALSSYYERHNMHIGLNSVSLDMSVSDNSGDNTNATILQEIFDIEVESEGSQYDKYLNCTSVANEYERGDTDNAYGKYYKEIIHIVETSADITIEEKKIFKGLFVNGETISNVAESLNKSIQNIRYKRQKVLNYIKEKLSDQYDITSFAALA